MIDSESWYISQLIDSRLQQEVNKALLEKKAAMQRKKEFDQHANETINDWVTEMKKEATAQEKPLPEMNCSPWADEVKAQHHDILRVQAQIEKNKIAQKKQPIGALGRACLMFKILTNIDMTEQQAEKFLDLVKVCEGHTND
jgi:K+-sensing histidine kinase KdpD